MPAGTVNPDLVKERNKCTFDKEEFTRWWYGGEEELERKRLIEKHIYEMPDLVKRTPLGYLSHVDLYEDALKMSIHMMKKIHKLQEEGLVDVDNYVSVLGGIVSAGLFPEGGPLAMHFLMFLPAIMGQATPEQQEKWLARAWNFEIIGTYSQTELGHGTFIRGLETTATYDEGSQEFVLDSPTLTSYKWWPGGLGQTANYTILVAQLYSKGKCHGIHPFILQLRDEETHMPLPGITVGEIGAKMGLNATNNGFLILNKVRIPREHMLMRNAQVLQDGTFVKPPVSGLTYGTMMYVRVIIVKDMAAFLSRTTTIAIRYSAVRRQSPINPEDPEPQILDHITQQHKLFPVLAKCIAFKLTSDNLWEMYNQVTSELNEGDNERLPELHALACCLKAISTNDATAGTEICRLACGGHGFIKSSSLPNSYSIVSAAITYEGENTVLLLQTARYLLKVWPEAVRGDKLVPTVAYLERAAHKNNLQRYVSSMPGIIMSLQAVAAGKIATAFNNIEKRKSVGNTQQEAANYTSIELVGAAEAHCRAFIVQSAYEMVEKLCSKLSQPLLEVLRQLIQLFAVDTCMKCLGDLLRYTTMTDADVSELQITLEELLLKIRPNAVNIVDAFDIPDTILDSALGVYDGNVYEKLFEEAMKSPLNQEPVNKSFHLHLKPFMRAKL